MGNDAGRNDRPRRTEHTKRRIKHSMGKNGTQPTTKNVTPAVTPWGKNRVKNTETGNHVLIMPGIGYTVDRPLLYWAAQALAANGWFVDLLNPPPFDKHKSVIPAPLPGTAGSPMPLICAGDADPYYDDAKAHLLTDHVRTYAGANHSIEVPDDWQTSLDYLKQVTQAIVDYAG